MLRWMCRHTRSNRIKNKNSRDKVGVTSVVVKMRRTADAPVRKCERLDVVGMKRGRGRLEKYWREVIDKTWHRSAN